MKNRTPVRIKNEEARIILKNIVCSIDGLMGWDGSKAQADETTNKITKMSDAIVPAILPPGPARISVVFKRVA